MDQVQYQSAATSFALGQSSVFDALDMWKERDWARFDLVRSVLLREATSGAFSIGEAQAFAQFVEVCVKPNVQGARRCECEFRAFLKRPTGEELRAVEASALKTYLACVPRCIL